MSKQVIDSMVQHMDKSLATLKAELAKVRTGRANAAMLDSVRVDYYGTPTPIQQLASFSSQDARTILVAP